MDIRYIKTTFLRVATVMVVLVATLSVSLAAYAAPTSPFVGHWQAIDVDGSDIRLSIAAPPNGPYKITWTESYISFCNREAGIVRGVGWLSEEDANLLEADLRVECFTTGASLEFHLVWRYHPTTNTLSSIYENGFVTIWHRPGGGQVEEPPAPGLRVNYGHDWVESFYEAGHTAWVTVTDGEGNLKATVEVVTEPKWYWDGETGFQSSDSEWFDSEGNPLELPPDLQPYDWVYAQVDNGATAQVQLGEIGGEVKFHTDSVMGTIMADWLSDPVQVECLDWGSGQEPPFDNKDGGLHSADGSDPYSCSWEGEWDVQPWQDIGVGYFTPEGHWVANAFRDERWEAVWTYDLPASSLQEGEHSYIYHLAYTVPEYVDYPPMGPQTFTVSGGTPIYGGYALIGPWDYMPVRVWNGSACEVVSALAPDQPIRFISGWVNDYSMTYEEALAHFNSITVDLFWDGEAIDPASFTMSELLPFTGRDDRIEHICTFTEHL